MTCALGICTCQVTDGETHCSPACQTPAGAGCACGHAVCDAAVGLDIDVDVFDPHTLGESVTAPTATPIADGEPASQPTND